MDGRDRGNLVHTILAFISTEKDIDAAIEKTVQEGLASASESSSLKELLTGLVRHPDLAAAFSGKGKVRKETELLLPNGKRLRPDRVIELKDETIILDYKTGEEKPAHKKQIDGYAEVLKEMGYTSIKKKIVYTETLVVESWENEYRIMNNE